MADKSGNRVLRLERSPDDIDGQFESSNAKSKSVKSATSTPQIFDAFRCLLCVCVCRDDSARWHHVNVGHITRHQFPSVTCLQEYGRNVCDLCGFTYARRWKTCRRSDGPGKSRCNGAMVNPKKSKGLLDSFTPQRENDATADDDTDASSGVSCEAEEIFVPLQSRMILALRVILFLKVCVLLQDLPIHPRLKQTCFRL